MIDTASGGDGGRLVDLIARLEKTYRRAVDDVNRATDRDIDRAARRKMLLEFGEPTAASAPPPGGNSREAVRVVCAKACELVAAGLNRDQIPLHVGAVDAPPEADPVLTDRREAMPRQMDSRKHVMNRWPCGMCRHMTRTDDGVTWCGSRGGSVAPSQRAQHPEGEPCYQPRAAA